MEDRKEKLFNSYLNSIVGDSPTLSVLKQRVGFVRGISEYMYKETYYVNGIRVGSRSHGTSRISMDFDLYDKTKKLFGLTNGNTSIYFREWLSKIPSNE
jgi:hypothetical protein